MDKEIVVVGSINMDLVSHGQTLPLPGETVRGTRFNTFAGGKGANQAVAVAKLGYPVSLIGKIGDDVFGLELLQGLKDAAVDVTFVQSTRGSSGVAAISTDELGQNTIMVVPGANDQLRPADIESASSRLSDAGLVLAQLEIPIETVCALAEVCSRYRVPLILDPAPARKLPKELLEQVAWLTPNETEASELLPNTVSFRSLEQQMKCLLALGSKGAILKLGSRGAAASSGECSFFHVPAFPVNAVDSTAAGDCFNAAFAVATMRGANVFDAVRFAAAAAAISVTRQGAQRSMPLTEEVESVVSRLTKHPKDIS